MFYLVQILQKSGGLQCCSDHRRRIDKRVDAIHPHRVAVVWRGKAKGGDVRMRRHLTPRKEQQVKTVPQIGAQTYAGRVQPL